MAKATKTTKITPEQEYKKELRRIQQFMNRASKRGFFWEKSPVPKQPKKITTKSVERLRKITPDVLYKKGEYVVQETGEVISGTKGRNLERKSATEKAKETRKAKQAKTKKSAKPKSKKEKKPKDKKESTPKQKKDTKTNTKQKPKDNPIYSPDDDEDERNYDDDYYPNFVDIVLSNFHAQLAQFPNAEGTPLLLSWFDTLIADNGREAVAQMLQDGAEQGLLITWETVYKSVNTKTYMTEMMNYLPDQGKFYTDQIMDMMEQFEWWEQPE